jgi:hypothetical protein
VISSGGAAGAVIGNTGSSAGPTAIGGSANALANPLPRVDKQFQSFQFADNARLNGFYTIPPDPMGTASKSRLLAVVNVAVELRNKGGKLLDESGLQAFFGDLALGSPFDPKVVYDEHSGRLLVVALVQESDSENISQILLAVSKSDSPDTLSEADWYFTAIDSKAVIFGFETWADYPGFEVDEEAVYITNNMFTFSPFGLYGGSRLWIVDKGEHAGGFYAGGPADVSMYDPYADAGLATTTMPALVHGKGGVGGAGSDIGTFLVSYSGLSDGLYEYLQVVTVRDPLGRAGGPVFEQEFLLIGDIEALSAALPGAPQADTAITINTNDRRALDAVWRDGALWMTTTIDPNFGEDQGQATATWFKVATSAGPGQLVIEDAGLVGGEDIAPGTFTFFPAIAVNRRGDMKIGFSASAPSIYAGAYVTGKRVEDPQGTVRPSNVVRAGEDYYYRTFGGTRNRWGDYSGIAVDPSNDMFFWVFNEYAAPRGNILSAYPSQDGVWGTTWGRGRF